MICFYRGGSQGLRCSGASLWVGSTGCCDLTSQDTSDTTLGPATTASPADRPVPGGTPKGEPEATKLLCRWHALFGNTAQDSISWAQRVALHKSLLPNE